MADESWIRVENLHTEPRQVSDGGLYTDPAGKSFPPANYTAYLLRAGDTETVCTSPHLVRMPDGGTCTAVPVAFCTDRKRIVVQDEKTGRRFVIETNTEGLFVPSETAVPADLLN